MTKNEKILVVVLRLTGLLLLLALGAVFMPFGWMDRIHGWIGLGELPNTPMIGYLTRSLSALYAVHGVLVLFISIDVRRYLPVVRCLAVISLVFGVGMIGLDYAVGLPLWWILGEGPSVIALGVLLLWLAGRVE